MKTKSCEEIGAMLKAVREELGFTQAALVRLASMTVWTISTFPLLERGDLPRQIITRAMMLTRFLGPKIFAIAHEGWKHRHADAEEMVVKTAAAIFTLLERSVVSEHRGRVKNSEVRFELWAYTWPTLKQIGVEMGFTGHFGMQEALQVSALIEGTSLAKYWDVPSEWILPSSETWEPAPPERKSK